MYYVTAMSVIERLAVARQAIRKAAEETGGLAGDSVTFEELLKVEAQLDKIAIKVMKSASTS
jgi:hypothetical protein